MTMPENAPSIPETIVFDLAPKAGGPPYRIFLRLPPGEAPEAGWPALYLLDGNAVIGTAVEAIRVQADYPTGTGIRQAAIVAIGYPTDAAYDSVRRSWDMGPPPGKTYPPHAPDGPDVRTGGADDFLTFIEEELKPEISRRIPLDRARQALFGHSFGGLFVLHALFTRPDAFACWIAISPAIWWEDAVVLRSETHFSGGTGTRVLLAAAEYEQALAPFHERLDDREQRRARYAANRVVDNAREMADRLGQRPEIEPEFVLFEGETHMSVLPVAVNRAIRFAFGPDAP